MPGMDALLDSSDLGGDRGVLAGKNIQAEPCARGYPTILLVSNDFEQLGCAVASLRRDNAKLGQVTADRVRRALAIGLCSLMSPFEASGCALLMVNCIVFWSSVR